MLATFNISDCHLLVSSFNASSSWTTTGRIWLCLVGKRTFASLVIGSITLCYREVSVVALVPHTGVCRIADLPIWQQVTRPFDDAGLPGLVTLRLATFRKFLVSFFKMTAGFRILARQEYHCLFVWVTPSLLASFVQIHFICEAVIIIGALPSSDVDTNIHIFNAVPVGLCKCPPQE
uniref:Uncharacterized protein n=1 Tax=Rhipicephalus microplus TaxID=6941 RepID=A0A6G5AH07_RHIMP